MGLRCAPMFPTPAPTTLAASIPFLLLTPHKQPRCLFLGPLSSNVLLLSLLLLTLMLMLLLLLVVVLGKEQHSLA